MKRRGFFKLMGGVALLTTLPAFPRGENVIPYHPFLLGRGAIVEWQPEKLRFIENPMDLRVKKHNYKLSEVTFIGG